MKSVRLVVPRGAPCRWRRDLAENLGRAGWTVALDFVEAAPEAAELAALGRLERAVFARRAPAAAAPLAAWDATLATADGAPDWIFDLTDRRAPAPGAVAVCYDGAPGARARDRALLAGRAPRLTLERAGPGGNEVLAAAQPALERPGYLTFGRAALASRIAPLIEAFLAGGPARPLAAPREAPPPPVSAARALFNLAAEKIRNGRRRRKWIDGHWRIGWRRIGAGGGLYDNPVLDAADWTFLEDDGRRFFADPFGLEEGGRAHVLCEEFPYATGKGVISAFEIDAAGRASRPEVVLERPCHLSYPFLFRYAGEIWMVPETSGARTLELYRAARFPDRWELDRVLLEDVDLADATIFLHEGRWRLTASTTLGGSSWDCLAVYAADTPLGPWRPCGPAPALIDAASARPAGAVVERDGALWRPAQDCSRGYGSGLTLARIDRADETGFAQTASARLAPTPGFPSQGVHTLNRVGAFELIDACGPRARP